MKRIIVATLLYVSSSSATDPIADMYISNARVRRAWVATFANLSLCEGIRTIIEAVPTIGKAAGNEYVCVGR